MRKAASMKERTAPVADSTIPKATPVATFNSNLTADAATSTQIPTSDPSTLRPTPAKDEKKTLIEYAKSTVKQSVMSMDGTFTLIGKSLYFSNCHTL